MNFTSFTPVRPASRLAALLALSLAASAAQAGPVLNTPNAATLTGWTTAGDVAVQSGSAKGIVLAQTSLLLGTASTDTEDDTPDAAGAFNISGLQPLAAAGPLEFSVGLPVGALDDNTHAHFALEGSSAFKSFSVQAGDTLTVDWQLFTRPNTGVSPIPDAAWLVWTQGSNTQLFKLGDLESLAMGTSTGGWLGSALQQTVVTASFAGTAQLGLLVADVDSFDTTSVLSVSNVVQASTVPEPEDWALGLAGVMALFMMHRRTTRRR